jgi:acetolactate synthase-1/3 small subunit
MEEYAVSILVDNQGEVLSRISSLFNRRGYKINSLSFGKTENPKLSRMEVAFSSDSQFIDQIINQIKKVVDVREVVELLQ